MTTETMVHLMEEFDGKLVTMPESAPVPLGMEAKLDVWFNVLVNGKLLITDDELAFQQREVKHKTKKNMTLGHWRILQARVASLNHLLSNSVFGQTEIDPLKALRYSFSKTEDGKFALITASKYVLSEFDALWELKYCAKLISVLGFYDETQEKFVIDHVTWIGLQSLLRSCFYPVLRNFPARHREPGSIELISSLPSVR